MPETRHGDPGGTGASPTLPAAVERRTLGPPMGLVGRFLRCLGAHYNSWCGWAAYRLGWTTAARRHYERVLVLRGADFTAYVQLGRISFALGDYAGWRREFEHARRADPHRFARLRQPFELFEPRLAGTEFDETGERATWRELRPFGGSMLRRTQRASESGVAGIPDLDIESFLPPPETRGHTADPARARGGTDDGENGDERRGSQTVHDDCASTAERRRFRDLGPIRAVDVAHCDFDDLARRLSG